MNVYKSLLCTLILFNALPTQAIDWSYWYDYRKPAAYVSLAGAGIGAIFAWRIRANRPTPVSVNEPKPTEALVDTARELLQMKYALNSIKSSWNLGGGQVYDMSAEEYQRCLPQMQKDPESFYEKRIDMSEENLTPDKLRELKDKIVRSCNFKALNQEDVIDYTGRLKSTIDQYQPAQQQADQELIRRLEYRQQQMTAFQEILTARKFHEHKKRLCTLFKI